MIKNIDLTDVEDYLNIMLKATNNLRELVMNNKTNIQIMYGDNGLGKYFVQYLIDEYENCDIDLSIVESIENSNDAFALAKTLSNLYGLDLIQF